MEFWKQVLQPNFPSTSRMKLQEGRKYGAGFAVFGALWASLGMLSSLLDVPEPGYFGFAACGFCLVIYQAYSGVFLDKSWVASVSKSKNPTSFWMLLLGQSAIAGFALYQAFK
ncbi:MAG: hypothetical protein Q7J29_15275 [Stagnimonas sp.]|nr:hypothetical protein [Stagnimonas sp.]